MKYTDILNFIAIGNKTQFDIPISEQLNYLRSLGYADNNYTRSLYQYRCYNLFVPKWKVFVLEFFSIFILPIFLISSYFLTLIRYRSASYSLDCIGENKGMSEILPTCLLQQYSISQKEWLSGSAIFYKDIIFCLNVLFRTKSPYLSLKSSIKISKYSYMINAFKLKAIQVCGEYSFTSSILTEYCKKNDVVHINVMHGEKLLYIRDSYFNFDKCYVWDEHYKNMFISLMANPDQFIIAVPPSLMESNDNFKESSYSDYKYYLQIYNESELKSIIGSLAFVKESGKTIKFRYHPRFSNVALLRQYIQEDMIEIPSIVPIQESIASCSFAIGSFTTALSQAYLSKKNVILDDVTFIDQYKKLKELDYILSKKDVRKLSDFQKYNPTKK